MEKSKLSQNEQILTHLLAGGSITPLEALVEFGCFRLGARIYDLKNDRGIPIESRMVKRGGKRYAEYYIKSAGCVN